MSIERTPPATADELELMRGTPPPAERLVTLENWIDPPWNRWALQHIDELIPCARVMRGSDVWELPADDRPLDRVSFEVDGQAWTWGEMLPAVATDALAVLHRGAVIYERYLNGMTPATRHLCFSVTKSVVATLAGILVGRGAVDPAGRITDVLPELAGTSWHDATIQHVLDMRTGTRFSEVYEEEEGDITEFGQVIGYFPRTDDRLPVDTYAYLAALPADREHGGRFDYRTPLTSLLGWICERAGGDRLPALLGRELWQPMGAEADAAITVDAHGNAFSGGGFSATLRDLARFGELWRLGGCRQDGGRIVPAGWITDTIAGAPDGAEAYAAQADHVPDPDYPNAFYRNKWWVFDPDRPLYTGIGIHGQWITIDAAAELVVARFSSQPVPDDEEHDTLFMAGVRAIAEELAG